MSDPEYYCDECYRDFNTGETVITYDDCWFCSERCLIDYVFKQTREFVLAKENDV